MTKVVETNLKVYKEFNSTLETVREVSEKNLDLTKSQKLSEMSSEEDSSDEFTMTILTIIDNIDNNIKGIFLSQKITIFILHNFKLQCISFDSNYVFSS